MSMSTPKPTHPVSMSRPARARAALARAAVLAALSALPAASCAPATLSHSASHPLEERDARRSVRKLTQTVDAAKDIRITATLWDPVLFALPLRDGPPDTKMRSQGRVIPETAEERLERVERWHRDYLADRTSFTVMIELRNRPEFDEISNDLLVAARNWNFGLRIDRGETIKPQLVRVQAMDRFPRRGAGWHWRIAVAVHFPGSLHDTSAKDGSKSVQLLIDPPKDTRESKFGKYLEFEYEAPPIPLHWRVHPPASGSSVADAHGLARPEPAL